VTVTIADDDPDVDETLAVTTVEPVLRWSRPVVWPAPVKMIAIDRHKYGRLLLSSGEFRMPGGAAQSHRRPPYTGTVTVRYSKR
jgi:hypothetical protein